MQHRNFRPVFKAGSLVLNLIFIFSQIFPVPVYAGDLVRDEINRPVKTEPAPLKIPSLPEPATVNLPATAATSQSFLIPKPLSLPDSDKNLRPPAIEIPLFRPEPAGPKPKHETIVHVSSDAGFQGLQAAIDRAEAGDTIYLDGTFTASPDSRGLYVRPGVTLTADADHFNPDTPNLIVPKIICLGEAVLKDLVLAFSGAPSNEFLITGGRLTFDNVILDRNNAEDSDVILRITARELLIKNRFKADFNDITITAPGALTVDPSADIQLTASSTLTLVGPTPDLTSTDVSGGSILQPNLGSSGIVVAPVNENGTMNMTETGPVNFPSHTGSTINVIGSIDLTQAAEDWVREQYRALLGREGEEQGVGFWKEQYLRKLSPGNLTEEQAQSEIQNEIRNSASREYQSNAAAAGLDMAHYSLLETAVRIYRAAHTDLPIGSDPDQNTRNLQILKTYADRLRAGETETHIVEDLKNPAEPTPAVNFFPDLSDAQVTAPLPSPAISSPIGNTFYASSESTFITQLSTGIYEVSLDAFMQSQLDAILTPELRQKYSADLLTQVELTAIQTRMMEQLAGLYDFVVFLPTTTALSLTDYYGTMVSSGILGLGSPLKQDIHGIGINGPMSPELEALNLDFAPLFAENFSAYMAALNERTIHQGNAAVHLSVTEQYATALEVDPFRYEQKVLLEEIAHRWAIYLSSQGNPAQNPLGILGRDNAHWSPFFNAGTSPMDGFQWQDLGNGQFRLQKAFGIDPFTSEMSSVFNDFDLYSMGLLSPSSVTSSYVIDNPRSLSGQPLTEESLLELFMTEAFWQNPVIQGTRHNIAISDITAIEGARNPASATAQKNFNAAFVLLKAPGENTSSSLERNRMNELASNLSSLWNTATRGLSTLSLGPAAGAFNAFRDQAVAAYDWFVSVIQQGGEGQPARAAALQTAQTRAQTDLTQLASLDTLLGQIDAVLNPLRARAQTEPDVAVFLGTIPVQVDNLRQSLATYRSDLQNAVNGASGISAVIDTARTNLTHLVNQAATSGILPLGFGSTTDAAIENIDTTYAVRTQALSAASQNFEPNQTSINSTLDSILTTLTTDTQPPTGSIVINNGDALTASRDVTLTLTASDVLSGVDQIQFSTDSGTTWSTWETFKAVKSLTLPAGDGSKIVQYRIKDRAGLISPSFSDMITVDTTAPAIVVTSSIVTNKPSAYELIFTVDGMEERLSGTALEAVRIPSGPLTEGPNDLRIVRTDLAGNQATLDIVLTVNTLPPVGTVVINGGANYTNNRIVTLTLSASSGTNPPSQMRFSTDGGTTWTDWEAIAATKTLTLPAGDGTKTVSYQLRDQSGLTQTYTDTIYSGGTINEDLTWNSAGSPYLIENSVTVAQGVTLTIEPGVTVKFANGKELTVTGILNAQGTQTDPISFTSSQAVPKRGDWAGIFFSESGSSNSQIAHAKIEYATSGFIFSHASPTLTNVISTNNSLRGFFIAARSNPTLTNVVSTNNSYGFDIFYGSNPTITGATASGNDYDGFFIYRSNPSLIHVISTHNGRAGISIYDSASPIITNSQVIQNTNYGFYIESTGNVNPDPTVNRTNIYGNQTNVYVSGTYADPRAVLDFIGNWWGTTDINAIQASITDGLDVTGLPTIAFAPYFEIDPTISQEIPVSVTSAGTFANPAKGANFDLNAHAGLPVDWTLVIKNTSGNVIRTVTQASKFDAQFSWDGKDESGTILPDGSYTWHLTAQDPAGILSTTSRQGPLFIDTMPPALTVLSPNLINNPAAYELIFTMDGVEERLSGTALEAIRIPSGPLTEGANVLRIVRTDLAGNQAVLNVNVIMDTVPPTGTVTISNGAVFTGTTDVTLALTAIDATSGIDQMQFSTDDGATWSVWETFQDIKTLTLPAGDGSKTVKYRIKDKTGLLSASYSYTITLDTIAPTGSVVINQGNETTSNLEVVLTLTAADATSGVASVQYLLDGESQWTAWEPFSAEKTVTLSAGDGSKRIEYRVKDSAGHVSEIYFDTVAVAQRVVLGAHQIPFNPPMAVKVYSEGSYELDYQNGHYVSDAERKIQLSGGPKIEFDFTPQGDPKKLTTFYANGQPAYAVEFEKHLDNRWIITRRTEYNGGIAYRIWTLDFDKAATELVLLSPSSGAVNSRSITYYEPAKLAQFVQDGYVRGPMLWDHFIEMVLPENYFYSDPSGQPPGFVSLSYSYDSNGQARLDWVSHRDATDLDKVYTLIPRGNGFDITSEQIEGLAVRNLDALKTLLSNNAGERDVFVAAGVQAGHTTEADGVTYSVTMASRYYSNQWLRFSARDSYGREYFSAGAFPDGEGGLYAILLGNKYQVTIDAQGLIHLADTTPPTAAITINNGAQYTNTPDVTLTLRPTDETNRIDQMRFSTDNGITWTTWEAFATTKMLMLPAGHGSKTVQIQMKDRSQNLAVSALTIILDTHVVSLSNQNLTTNNGIRKTMILGPLFDGDNEPLTYSYTPSSGLASNGRFELLGNQLTYISNNGFVGTGTIIVEATDGFQPVPATIVLDVKAPQTPHLNDPGFDLQYALNLTDAVRAWNLSRGAGINVAVIDMGIDLMHPDLDGNIFSNPGEIASDGIDNDGNSFVDDIHGWDFVDQDHNPSPTDQSLHGTHVAGIVAAENNNSIGGSGIAPDVKIMPLRVLKEGWDYIDPMFMRVANAMIYAVKLGARVINMSLGLWAESVWESTRVALQSAINYARQAGAVVVAAAGNSDRDVSFFIPAGMEGVITVGATSFLSDSRAYFSNFGRDMEVVAPGVDIYSTVPVSQGSYWLLSGTSMSSPLVAGLAALILSQDPTATDVDVLRRLKYSSKDLGEPGFDPYYGWGRIDAFQALSYDYYDNGTIKTQWLEEPDEHGWNRLNFDPEGRLIGGILAGTGSLSAASSFSEEDFPGSLGIHLAAGDSIPLSLGGTLNNTGNLVTVSSITVDQPAQNALVPEAASSLAAATAASVLAKPILQVSKILQPLTLQTYLDASWAASARKLGESFGAYRKRIRNRRNL